MRKLIFQAAGVVMLFAATIQAQNAGDRVNVSWSDPARPGLVKVSILNGAISVRTHSGRDVIVEGRAVANRQPAVRDGLRRIDLAGGGLIIEEQNNVLTISNGSFVRGGSIDIQVPARTNLTLSAFNGGAITVEGVEGEIEVTNTNGNVMLTNVAGSVVAHAMNGRLTVVMREVTQGKALSFTSMNSNVDVTLPASTKANLKIRADNGGAWSDFDIQNAASTPVVDDSRNTANNTNNNNNARGRAPRVRIETARTTTGTINGGGPDVEIRTLNGDIFLRKGK